MKAVMIIHNDAIDVDVTEALEALGVKSYSKLTGVLGKGLLSEPRLNTEVWPGTNIATFVVTDETAAARIISAVAKMREKLASEGIKAFSWHINEIT